MAAWDPNEHEYSSAHSDFASGDILSESSSWDDIFAFMDI